MDKLNGVIDMLGKAISDLSSLQSKGKTKEEVREAFCLWYYAESQPLDANKVFDWFWKQMESHANQDGWVSVEDDLPDLIKGQDYSEPVFAICEGEMLVMRSFFIREGDGYRAWANCYGDIDGDGEYDDQYDVSHWHKLTIPPKPQI